MTRTPRTLAIIDAGGATTSVSLVVRIERQWRLVGTMAGPSGTSEDALLAVVAERARIADSTLAAWPDIEIDALPSMPRLAARSRRPATLLVIGASRRAVGDMEAAAHRTAWRVTGASTESHDPREMTALALDPRVDAVLIGAGDPPGPDERASLDDLAALGGSIARRRPELRMLVGASIRGRQAWAEAAGDEPVDPGRVVDAPSATGRQTWASALGTTLDALLADPEDGREALGKSASTIAEILDLRVELLDIGFNGGTRLVAEPGTAGSGPSCRGITTAAAGLVPPEPDEETVDSVLAWTTGSLDRHRMSDRLRDLRLRPWVDASGDGARLRLAAGTAALARLAALTPELSGQPPADLTVISGGAFAMAPPSAVALAIADTLRRSGTTQLAWDHARLLGPVGTIDNADERRSLLADLIHDALVPLGSLVIAGGVRHSRLGRHRSGSRNGRLRLDVDGKVTERDVVGGELALVDLPAGAVGMASLEFSETVRLGRRTHRVAAPVSGGLAGFILDVRNVPLSLPEGRDRRRARLADWASQVWPRDDR